MLHSSRLESIARNKYSSLLDTFVSYEENKAFRVQPLACKQKKNSSWQRQNVIAYPRKVKITAKSVFNVCPQFFKASQGNLHFKTIFSGTHRGTFFSHTSTRESLLKGRDQYGWPPWTCKLRSASFFTEFFFLFCQTNYLKKEANCTDFFLSVRVPCLYPKSTGNHGQTLPDRMNPGPSFQV